VTEKPTATVALQGAMELRGTLLDLAAIEKSIEIASFLILKSSIFAIPSEMRVVMPP
jgi:hypothetical protein